MPLRAFLRAAILALALLPAGGALTALADDGRPPDATGHPPSPIPVPRSELRPSAIHPASTKAPTSVDMPGAAALPKKELVIFVGGYGSSAGDGAFDQLKNEFADGHYDVVRFGADPPFRYDTYDAIDRSADALIDEIRALGPGYSAVNIVSHSMGGAVVDRAFDKGLGAGDGVATDIAIAGPHSGAFFAAVPTETFPLIGGVKDIVRDVAMTVAGPDPESRAARDLATFRPVAPPRGVVRLDTGLATDGFVSQADARDPGVPQRVFLPGSPGEAIDGHGGSLTSKAVVQLVGQTVREHRIPPDNRDPITRTLVPIVWPLVSDLWRKVVLTCVLVTLVIAVARVLPLVRSPIDRAIAWCRADLRRRGR